jgi:hypothetical protein
MEKIRGLRANFCMVWLSRTGLGLLAALECSIAIAQQDSRYVLKGVQGQEIYVPMSVEVCGCQCLLRIRQPDIVREPAKTFTSPSPE